MNDLTVDKDALFVNMVLSAWHTYTKRVTEFIDKTSDEGLLKQVAPGRKRVYYLVGHVTVVNDRMLHLLGFEKAYYGDLDEMFLSTLDHKGLIGSAHEVARVILN